jgi:beta-glucosidase
LIKYIEQIWSFCSMHNNNVNNTFSFFKKHFSLVNVNCTFCVNSSRGLHFAPRVSSFCFYFSLALLVACGNSKSDSSKNITTPDTGAVVSWPAVSSAVSADVDIDIAIILDSMTLEEKVGQMVMAEIQAVTADEVRDYHLGAVLNGGGSWPNKNKNASIADWVDLADDFYLASIDTIGGRAAIPVLWGTDAVHGHNNVKGATIFPHNIGLGAMNDPALMRQIGEVTALEVAVTGIDWVFAPTLAVVRNDRWGRTYEGYSEDPELVKAYASEVVAGLQGDGFSGDLFSDAHVLATAKHFIGDGGTKNGDDQGDTVITEQALRDIHGQGYFSALDAGAQTVMASYSSWNGSKLHGDEYLLTDVLKGQMGFDGFVLGDWNGHAQVPGCSNDSCAQAFNAGVDMMMVPNDWEAFITNTLSQVLDGTISLERVDDAVTRILRVKMRSGIFNTSKPSDRTYANNESLIASVEHKALARQAVRESLVLLKNKNGILPLSPSSNVLVAGVAANNISRQSGGWTLSWQGTGLSNNDFPQATSILSGIESAVTTAGGSTVYSSTASFDEETPPDVAIVVFGEPPYAEYAGDLNSLEYQYGVKSDLALLNSLKAQNIPVVSIFLSGRPLWMNKEINASNAFVAAWLPGSEGAGIADVLFTNDSGAINYDFSGMLSFSWPKQASQQLLNRYDEEYQPLFPYGFGLSYQDTDTLGDDLSEISEAVINDEVVSVPGTIEAELFTAMLGIQAEQTSDVGGGDNIGYTNSGDWLEYTLDIGSAGSYSIEYRVASLLGSSGFNVLLDGVQIDSQLVDSTGGWQSWVTNTAATTVMLPAGEHTLRINSVGSNWNLNWIKLALTGN